MTHEENGVHASESAHNCRVKLRVTHYDRTALLANQEPLTQSD